jgi:hypothetical protein
MKVEDRMPLLESIFEEWEEVVGRDVKANKNHVYRVVSFSLALRHDLKEVTRRSSLLQAASMILECGQIRHSISYLPLSN